MTREKITLTAEFKAAVFKAAVKEYQKANDLKSWSATLIYLAAIGYEKETGKTAPGPLATWGGKRDKQNNSR